MRLFFIDAKFRSLHSFFFFFCFILFLLHSLKIEFKQQIVEVLRIIAFRLEKKHKNCVIAEMLLTKNHLAGINSYRNKHKSIVDACVFSNFVHFILLIKLLVTGQMVHGAFKLLLHVLHHVFFYIYRIDFISDFNSQLFRFFFLLCFI